MDKEIYIKEHNDYCGVSKWHSKGYTGKGVTVWNCERTKDNHGRMSRDRVLDSAPDANVITGTISIRTQVGGTVKECYVYTDDGEYVEINDWITKNNVKIMTCSLQNFFKNEGSYEGDFWKDISERHGVIIVNSAGNDGDREFDFSKRVAWHIGAVYLDTKGQIERAHYSSTGEGLDFVDFAGWASGTSFSTPYFAGKCALVLQKHPNFTPEQVYDYMMFCSKDLEAPGEDSKTGHGLPILPELFDNNSDNKDKAGDDEMAKKTKFVDVPEGAWYEEAVAFCVENGYMKGLSDTEFKPNEPLTRAQMAQVLMNVFKK